MVRLEVIQGERPTEKELALAEAMRPRTRGECEGSGLRPCPFISCRMHLLTNTSASGDLRFAGLPKGATDEQVLEKLGGMASTCALDVVEENPDGLTMEDVGGLLSLTRERVRQIEMWRAGNKLASSPEMIAWFGERKTVQRKQEFDPNKKGVTPRLIEKIKDLRAEGLKLREIAEAVADDYGSVPAHSTIRNWIKRGSVRPEQEFPRHTVGPIVLGCIDGAHTTKEALGLIEAKCGRSPTIRTLQKWIKREKTRLREMGELAGYHATHEVRVMAAKLRAEGLTLKAIAEKLEPIVGRVVRHGTISKWAKSVEIDAGA